jgi:hypothetical protein
MAKAVDELKALRRRYLELVAIHGRHATDFKRFRQTLLEKNERHRLEGVRLYMAQIARIERKMGLKK